MNRNLFLHEIKDNTTYVLIWTIILLGMTAGNTMPGALSAKGSAAGVAAAWTSGMTSIANVIPIFSMILGSLILSKEEDEKTIEFLLGHPITRVEIALSKIAAYSLCVLFAAVVLFAFGLVLVIALGPATAASVGGVALVSLAMLVFGYVFGAAGMLASVFLTKGGAAVGYSIGIPLILALLAMLQNVENEILRILSYISPFRYLDLGSIVAFGAIRGALTPVLAVLSLAFLSAVVAAYSRKQFAV
jgi:ABC-2 type transport system permease protein